MKVPSSSHTVPGSPAPDDPAMAQALLRSILQAHEPVILRLDENFDVRFINKLAPEFSLERVIGSPATSYVGIDPEAVKCWRAALDGTPGFYRSEVVAAPGVSRIYETWVAPYKGPDGRGVTLIAIEVTSYQEELRRLAHTEASLAMAQEATGIGLWSWEIATNKVRWNRRMEEISGQSEPLPLPEYMDRLVHPDDRPRLRASSEDLFQRQSSFSSAPYRIVREDGTLRIVVTVGTILRDELGRPLGVVGGTLDVTAHHQQEEIARQRQRLESIGQLTAGIAHNFNNVLATIIPTLKLLAGSAPAQKRELAEDALRSAMRAAESIQQLSHYARPPQGGSATSRVAEPLGRAVRLCHGLFSSAVRLVEDVEEGLPHAGVSDAELEQAVVNLLLNARDAVACSLEPKIVLRARELAPPPSLGWTSPTGRAICVAVSDNGKGMAPDVQSRVFEPFFTTKESPQGTGLGLATVEAMVKRVGGTVVCRSEPSKGATFELWFSAEPDAISARSQPSARASTPAEGQTVLIVDDERGVLQSTALLLEDGGYRVVTASSCLEALTRIHAERSISAVLLDRWLGDGSGTDLIDPIRQALPDAVIVLHSGAAISDDDRRRVDAALPKPATPEQLFEVLASQLARQGARL